jgi:small subunit ribosomal protein S6
MNQTKKQYETTFIVNASLEDSQIESAIAHVQEVITRNGGEISSLNKWGRKRLAYPIEKKNNGFYVNIEFSAPGAAISQLERIYQLDENTLRFLTIQLDEKALKAKLQVPTLPGEPTETVEQKKEPLFDDETKPVEKSA